MPYVPYALLHTGHTKVHDYIQITYRLHTEMHVYIQITYRFLNTLHMLHMDYILITYKFHIGYILFTYGTYELHTIHIQTTYSYLLIAYTTYELHTGYIRTTYSYLQITYVTYECTVTAQGIRTPFSSADRKEQALYASTNTQCSPSLYLWQAVCKQTMQCTPLRKAGSCPRGPAQQ